MVYNTDPPLQGQIDLAAARKNPSFDVPALTAFLYGGTEELEKRIAVQKILEAEELFSKHDRPFMSREERLKRGLAVSRRLIELRDDLDWSVSDFRTAIELIDDYLPTTLHYSAFIPSILSQGTQEQIFKWVPLAERHAIVGCYAQTELGHGSNVAGLETTATFDKEKNEFVIHSPTFTAAKWWIGGLGVIATHAIVQAQLILNGKAYGPHTFVVPVRSLVDHSPLPTVEIGDIGPKAYGGFAAIDNGYARFHHHRIPRENMLMKFAQVDKDGNYIKPPHSKLSYGSMVTLRSAMVRSAGWTLARGVTIATRYLTVRRQFSPSSTSPSKSLEAQVISYSTVRHRIFPLIALTYAILMAGQDMDSIFEQMMDELGSGVVDKLAEVHALSCGLKAWGTRRVADGLEECRKAMGGHGFSAFSGLSQLFADYLPSNTYEGDNFVLSQQTARFLLKQLQQAHTDPKSVTPLASYLTIVTTGQDPAPVPVTTFLDTYVQLRLFETRSARLVLDLAMQVQSGTDWTELNVECWNVTVAHTEYVVLKSFISQIETAEEKLKPILSRLSNLYALSTLSTTLSTFLSTKSLSPDSVPLLNQQLRASVTSFAPDAINLTDAFALSDYLLNSALGRYDGRAYEALFEAAKRDPANSDDWLKRNYDELIKPILKREQNAEMIKMAKL